MKFSQKKIYYQKHINYQHISLSSVLFVKFKFCDDCGGGRGIGINANWFCWPDTEDTTCKSLVVCKLDNCCVIAKVPVGDTCTIAQIVSRKVWLFN